MLAMADRNGNVQASVPGLAAFANVTIDECVAALKKLTEPDAWSRTKDHEGRRIIDIDGGWNIVNYVKYRELGREVDRAAYMREKQRGYRQRASSESVYNNNSLTHVNTPLTVASASVSASVSASASASASESESASASESEALSSGSSSEHSAQDDQRTHQDATGRAGAQNQGDSTFRAQTPVIEHPGAKEGHRCADYTAEFEQFWKAYPKKVGKGAAFKVWRSTASIRPSLDALLAAVAGAAATDQWKKDGGQYIPNPATWLNQRRWEDDVRTYGTKRSAGGASEDRNAAMGVSEDDVRRQGEQCAAIVARMQARLRERGAVGGKVAGDGHVAPEGDVHG